MNETKMPQETERGERKRRDLEQVGRVGVLLRSDKVLLNRSRRNESVEDVDGTRLSCQLVPPNERES
jgi:hypothetical protein